MIVRAVVLVLVSCAAAVGASYLGARFPIRRVR